MRTGNKAFGWFRSFSFSIAHIFTMNPAAWIPAIRFEEQSAVVILYPIPENLRGSLNPDQIHEFSSWGIIYLNIRIKFVGHKIIKFLIHFAASSDFKRLHSRFRGSIWFRTTSQPLPTAPLLFIFCRSISKAASRPQFLQKKLWQKFSGRFAAPVSTKKAVTNIFGPLRGPGWNFRNSHFFRGMPQTPQCIILC